MSTEKPSRAMKWLNVFLLVLNLSALTAFLGFNYSKDEAAPNQELASLKYLQQELSLSEKQYQEAVVLNDRTFRSYHILFDRLCETNVALLEELALEEPDDIRLDSLARSIGRINTSLKKETIVHFKNIRSICNSEQSDKLTLLFKSMMALEEQCAICNKVECPRRDRIRNIGKDLKEK